MHYIVCSDEEDQSNCTLELHDLIHLTAIEVAAALTIIIIIIIIL